METCCQMSRRYSLQWLPAMISCTNLLDKHAPKVTRCLAKEPAKWLSDTYKNAKSIRQQFERIWHKKKTPLNHARLRKQVARCNSLANKDKATYFRALVKENGDDPKKL